MRFYFIILCFILAVKSFGQIGFSNVYEMDVPGVSFNNLTLKGDTLIVIGTAKSNSLNQWGLLFAKLDTMGNLLAHQIHYDTLGDDILSSVIENPIINTADGGYIVTGSFLFRRYGFMAKLDTDGNLIFLREYPETDIKTYLFKKVIELTDGYLIAGSKQIENFTLKSFVMKTDLEGNLVWEKKYGDLNNDNSLSSIFKINENSFILGTYNGSYPVSSMFSYNTDWKQGSIIAIDSLGEIIWEWIAELNEETSIGGLHITQDGGFLYGTGAFIIENPWTWGWDFKIIKRDSNFNVEWVIEDITEVELNIGMLLNIHPAENNNWVAFGNWRSASTSHYPEGYVGGCTYKFTSTGESLWTRCDTVIEDGSFNYDFGNYRGSTIHPSGSIYSVGETRRFANPTFRSSGWLTKLDRNGCLDTLCDLSTAIPELSLYKKINIKIYPNPVDDFIFIEKETSNTLLFQINDALGRLISKGKITNSLHRIPFTKMNAGIYFVKVINPKTEQFIIEKIIK